MKPILVLALTCALSPLATGQSTSTVEQTGSDNEATVDQVGSSVTTIRQGTNGTSVSNNEATVTQGSIGAPVIGATATVTQGERGDATATGNQATVIQTAAARTVVSQGTEGGNATENTADVNQDAAGGYVRVLQGVFSPWDDATATGNIASVTQTGEGGEAHIIQAFDGGIGSGNSATVTQHDGGAIFVFQGAYHVSGTDGVVDVRQDGNSAVTVHQGSLPEYGGSDGGLVLTDQTGDGHTIEVFQNGMGNTAAARNTADIVQTGADHTATVHQQGVAHSADVDQHGSWNAATVTQR